MWLTGGYIDSLMVGGNQTLKEKEITDRKEKVSSLEFLANNKLEPWLNDKYYLIETKSQSFVSKMLRLISNS